MGSITEQSPSRANDSHKPNEDKEKSTETVYPSPYLGHALSLPRPTDPALVETELTYPEGGLAAWLVVLGAWCSLTASYGIYNTAGVFEAFISREILAHESKSTIGWIFGIYAFMSLFCGVQVGPTFDAKGPRGLLIAGSICTLVAIFALSTCTGGIKFHILLHA